MPFRRQKNQNPHFHVFIYSKDLGFNTSMRPKHIKNIICIFV